MVSLINFLFQKSFRPRFLSVAELLHEEGFKVGAFSYLKLESAQILKGTQPVTGMKRQRKKASTRGIFSWVIHKVSRYHPTKCFHDCLIQQIEWSHEGKNNPGSAISSSPRNKSASRMPCTTGGGEGEAFDMEKAFTVLYLQWYSQAVAYNICGAYIPLVTLLHQFASISLLKGNW